jgi:hypothetical protein
MNKDVAMNSSRRNFAAILEALGLPPSARRSTATPAAPACESLEGRQLLTGGFDLGGAVPGMAFADVAGIGGGGAGARASAISSIAASNPQLQTDLTKLQTDNQMIQDQSLVTPAMSSKVTADINAVKSAETTAAPTAMTSFLNAATTAINSSPGGANLGQTFALEAVQNAVYLSEGVSATLINQLDADEMAVMAATGITPAEEATLAADHTAITADQAKATPAAGTMIPAGTATPVAGTMTPATAATATLTVAGPVGAFAGMSMQGELQAAGAGVLVSSPTGGGVGMDSGMSTINSLGMPSIPTPPVASSPAAATLAADQATMKTDMQTLQTAVQAVQTNSNVTPAMEAVISADLAAVQGAASVAPNAADVATLKADYTTAMTTSGGPTATQLAQIQTDQAAVYESEGVNATLVGKLQSAQAAVTGASAITGAEEGAIYAAEQTVQADETKVQADVAALPPVTTTTTTTTNAGGTTTTAPATAPGFGFHRTGVDGFMP